MEEWVDKLRRGDYHINNLSGLLKLSKRHPKLLLIYIQILLTLGLKSLQRTLTLLPLIILASKHFWNRVLIWLDWHVIWQSDLKEKANIIMLKLPFQFLPFLDLIAMICLKQILIRHKNFISILLILSKILKAKLTFSYAKRYLQ